MWYNVITPSSLLGVLASISKNISWCKRVIFKDMFETVGMRSYWGLRHIDWVRPCKFIGCFGHETFGSEVSYTTPKIRWMNGDPDSFEECHNASGNIDMWRWNQNYSLITPTENNRKAKTENITFTQIWMFCLQFSNNDVEHQKFFTSTVRLKIQEPKNDKKYIFIKMIFKFSQF